MADGKKTITRRSEGHSDVADTPPFRKHVETLTTQEFGKALVAEARARGGFILRDLREEWVKSPEGVVYEITAELGELDGVRPIQNEQGPIVTEE